MDIFMHPNHGVKDGLLTNDFSTGGGTLIFHAIFFVEIEILRVRDVVKSYHNFNIAIPNIDYDTHNLLSLSSEFGVPMISAMINVYNVFIKPHRYIDTLFVSDIQLI